MDFGHQITEKGKDIQMARRVRQQGYQQVIRRLRCMYVEVVKGSGASEIVEKAPSAKPTVELFYQ